MRRLFFLLLLLVASPLAARSAAPAASPSLQARAQDVATVLAGKGDYDTIFAPSFRAQISKPQFDAVVAQLHAAGGAVAGVEKLTAESLWSGTLLIAYERSIATLKITVDAAEPHQITGLLVAGVAARETTLDDIVAAIAALPGSTGFAFDKLDGDHPDQIIAHNPDQPFAIGSAFKLVILAELVRGVNAGERHWGDLVTLDGTPLPSGFFADKPAGTEVTLRELAARMISVSDNSATDILLATLGRSRVEAMLPVVGFKSAARDRPYLSTQEMFKLKGIQGGALGARYRALDETGRRALLDGEIKDTPLSAISPDLFKDGKPVAIDTIEWFASPADLVRVMDWLRRNTEKGPGAEARAILARNAGVVLPVALSWAYVGYKGGSEPGVLNLTLLLRDDRGAWYVLTGSWNNPAAALDEQRFAALITRATELAAAR